MVNTGNPAMDILVENAKTFSERKSIFSLTESEQYQVNNNMVSKLFNSALDKSHVDFDDIPKSKGDITKYIGYQSIANSLDQLRSIAVNNGHKIPEIDIVDDAVKNIVAYRDVFEKGFKLNKDFIILQYNTIVAACVMAVSSLIVSYVEYLKRIDKVEFTIVNSKYSPGNISINSLNEFNRSVKSGEFSKVMTDIIKSGLKESAVQEAGVLSAIGIASGIIIGAISLVNIIRRLVFYFYYNKMRLSDYLNLQAKFLELNKNNLMASGNNMPPNKRDAIMKKQDKLIHDLRDLSEKLKVNNIMTTKKAENELSKENSNWKISDVKTDSASTDSNGFIVL